MAVRSSLALVLLALVTACSSAPEDDPRSGSPKVADTMGAPIPVSATPPPVLLASFEPASADCNGWIADGARSIRSVPPRTGTYACKLCADGSREEIAIARDVGPVEAGRYVLTAWTRKRPQNPAPATTIATLEAVTGAGVVVAGANAVTVREEWDRLEATIDVPEGASALRVRIGSPLVESEQCVLIDDVLIERAR